MRKIIYLALPFMAASALAVSSCGGGKKGAETTGCASVSKAEANENTVPFVTENVSWTDSVTVGGCKAVATISGKYPEKDNPAIVDSTRAWITLQLEALLKNSGGENTLGLSPVKEDLENGNRLVSKTVARLMDASRNDFKGFVKDSISTSYEFSAKFEPIFLSDSLVTYSYSSYVYLGGAHGGAVGIGQTFDRNTGVKLTYDNTFLPEKRQELVSLVKKGIADYFKESQEVDSLNLRDALLIDPDTLPLPAFAPEFVKDGVIFTYQQYEIAPYAAGMPSCVISYEALKPLFTSFAAPLVPVK